MIVTDEKGNKYTLIPEGESDSIYIPKTMTEKNRILTRAMTWLSEDESPRAKEIFKELSTLLDVEEKPEKVRYWRLKVDCFIYYPLIKGRTYAGDFHNNTGCSVKYLAMFYPYDWEEVSEEEYLRQEGKGKEFDGHRYMNGDMVFWFRKSDYSIQNYKFSLYNLCNETSKIYPTEQACREALYTFIWENHQVTAKEYLSIHYEGFCKESFGLNVKKHFCETIIKQKQG